MQRTSTPIMFCLLSKRTCMRRVWLTLNSSSGSNLRLASTASSSASSPSPPSSSKKSDNEAGEGFRSVANTTMDDTGKRQPVAIRPTDIYVSPRIRSADMEVKVPRKYTREENMWRDPKRLQTKWLHPRDPTRYKPNFATTEPYPLRNQFTRSPDERTRDVMGRDWEAGVKAISRMAKAAAWQHRIQHAEAELKAAREERTKRLPPMAFEQAQDRDRD